MPTLAQINAAANDGDLRARLELAAAAAGIGPTDTASRQAVWDRIVAVVSEPLETSASGQCIADVLAYAQTSYNAALAELPPTPGANPAAVTDEMLHEAVASLHQG